MSQRVVAFTGPIDLTEVDRRVVRFVVKGLGSVDVFISGAAFGVDSAEAALAAMDFHPDAEHRVYVPAAWHNREAVAELRTRGARVVQVPSAGSNAASYMARNDRMVADCTELVGFPYTSEEQRRCGAWATIRRARKAGRAIALHPLREECAEHQSLDSFQREGPWDAPDTLYFFGRGTPFSMFAPTPGLTFPLAWKGHPTPALEVKLPTGEHGFHFCKSMSERDALWILASSFPSVAKRRGGPRGEGGRRIQLRPDWEDVKFDVMLWLNRRKFQLSSYRDVLLATGDRPLVENSPSDDFWGGRDSSGGYTGENMLGLVLMQVRAELRGGLQ